MFSRTTPECDRPASEHDPLHLRIATAVVVLGLIATGVTVIWRDVAGHSGELVPQTASPRTITPQTASHGGLGQPSESPAATSGPRTGAGLRLLSEAAGACQHVSYHGVQRTAWQAPGGSWISLVNVWHQRDHQTLIQVATMPAAALPLPGASSTDPDGDGGDDDVGQRDPAGIMTMTSQMVALLAENYRVFLAGRGQVVGRSVQELVLRHLNGRLAARFWLDSVTKLPLRRETFDGRARMVSDDVFVSLKLGPPTAAAVPRTTSAPGGRPLAGGQLARLRAAGWPLPAQLPGQLTLLRASATGGPSDVVIDLAYSDGLSVISLFVQRGHLPAQLNGWSEIALHGDHVYASGRDQRSVAWSARGFVYTLIADAPDQTLDQVVDVLPHNGGPGFFGRMGRGLSRLVSWLDPFH